MTTVVALTYEQIEAAAESLRIASGCDNSEIVVLVSAENFARLQGIELSGDIRVECPGEPRIKPEKHRPWLRPGKGRGRSL